MMGAGAAANYWHTLQVTKYNWNHTQKFGEFLYASMSVAFGSGAVIWTAVYHALIHPNLRVNQWLTIQVIMFCIIWLLRLAVQHRYDLEEAIPLLPSTKTTEKGHAESVPTSASEKKNKTVCERYWFDPAMVLTFCTVLCTIGQSGSFLSIQGQVVAASLGSEGSDYHSMIGWATFGFMLSQTIARACVAVLATFYQKYAFFLSTAAMLNTAAFLVLSVDSTFNAIVVCSVLSGIAFGTTWASFPLHLKTYAPEDAAGFVGITFWAVLCGNVILAIMVPTILGSDADIHKDCVYDTGNGTHSIAHSTLSPANRSKMCYFDLV